MKTVGGNIDKTEDKIVRVDGPIPEDTANPMEQVSWINQLLPSLSILQLSDVGLKTKKTFKGKAGKALVVGQDERSIEFGDAGGGGNATPILIEYAPDITVNLGNNLNYILTLTGDCNLTFTNIKQGYNYEFLIIQDNIGGHILNIMHPCYYEYSYYQDTTANSHSKLEVDCFGINYYASIHLFEQRLVTITWEDWDGTTLLTNQCISGEVPEYTGTEPSRAGYVFTGWSPTPSIVTSSITYVAQYAEIIPGLCFTATTAGSTISLTLPSPYYADLLYSTDGAIWNTYGGDTKTLNSVGDKIYFRSSVERAEPARFSSGNTVCSFTMTGTFECSGDVTYLTNKTGGDVRLDYRCFKELFKNCTSLITPPTLPSTNIGGECYRGMFSGCTNLITAPELPATTLGTYCYASMFYGCTSLTEAPDLEATTISEGCYQGMFSGCTSLTAIPSTLPALTAPYFCYQGMFSGCTSLITAPHLPATTLNTQCYEAMFYGCTSLSTIPALPATTLTQGCYITMFRNCINIKLSTTQTGAYQTEYKIPSVGTGTDGNGSMTGMFIGTGGTFTGNPVINTIYYTSNTIV